MLFVGVVGAAQDESTFQPAMTPGPNAVSAVRLVAPRDESTDSGRIIALLSPRVSVKLVGGTFDDGRAARARDAIVEQALAWFGSHGFFDATFPGRTPQLAPGGAPPRDGIRSAAFELAKEARDAGADGSLVITLSATVRENPEGAFSSRGQEEDTWRENQVQLQTCLMTPFVCLRELGVTSIPPVRYPGESLPPTNRVSARDTYESAFLALALVDTEGQIVWSRQAAGDGVRPEDLDNLVRETLETFPFVAPQQ